MKHGWPLKKVGELFDVQLGKMLSPRAKEGDQFPYMANFNVQWGKFNLGNSNSMHFTESEKEKYSLKQGDILMCEGGEVGRCAIWNERSTNFYYQKALHRLRPKDKNAINPYFMCIYMEHVTANNGVTKIVGETSIAHLTREKLCALKIPCPPKNQQDKIVKTIGTWDAAIEKTERLIAAKERRFRWVVLWLINKAGHHEREVSDVTIEVSTRNRDNAIERVLSVTNHSGFILPEDQFERRVASANLSNYKIVNRGEYAYNPSRINVGSIARLDDWKIGALSPMYNVFKLDETKTASDYFLHWLSSYEAKQRIKNSAQGSVRETVNFGDLGAIPIPLPSMEKQRKIARKLNAIKHEITLLRQLAKKYHAQKRGLMQKLVMGEWTVKT